MARLAPLGTAALLGLAAASLAGPSPLLGAATVAIPGWSGVAMAPAVAWLAAASVLAAATGARVGAARWAAMLAFAGLAVFAGSSSGPGGVTMARWSLALAALGCAWLARGARGGWAAAGAALFWAVLLAGDVARLALAPGHGARAGQLAVIGGAGWADALVVAPVAAALAALALRWAVTRTRTASS